MDWTVAQSGIEHQHHSDFDHLFWSNRKTPKNSLLLMGYVALLILLFLILGASIRWLILSQLNDLNTFEKFSFVVYTIFWGYLFLRMSKTSMSFFGREQIKILDDEIILEGSGILEPKSIRISNHELEQMSFQKYPNGNFELFLTLNLIFKRDGVDNSKRVQVARWMRIKEKHHLFMFLKMLLEKRKWTVEFVDDYIES